MSKDTKKELMLEAFGIVPNTFSKEATDILRRLFKEVATRINKFEAEANNEYIKELDCLRAYLTGRGLYVPNNFERFLNWYYIHYSHIVDQEGYKGITAEQINEYSREVTAKLDTTTPTGTQPKGNKFSLKQIALICAYEGKNINKDNADKIAKKYGHNSGGKLYQHFNYYRKPNNRRGEPNNPTIKTVSNKIELIESVLPYLTEKNRALAIDELKTLRNILDEL